MSRVPQPFVSLVWGWLRTVLVYSLYGAVAAVISELAVFIVQGWTGGIAAGMEWAGPIGIMTAWRRSLVTLFPTSWPADPGCRAVGSAASAGQNLSGNERGRSAVRSP